jgi:ankyrin repeat protein
MSLQLLACEAGDADCVALLRHWDADQAEELLLSCFSEGPNAGHTPLSIAAKRGHYTVVHELLTEPPVTSPDSGPYEGAALFEAAAGGHTDIVRLLLERGARLECLGAPLALRAALAKRHWAVCAVRSSALIQ